MKLPFFKKADIILLVALIIIGAVLLFAFGWRGSLKLFGSGADRESGVAAVISVDGEHVDVLDLSSDQSVRIDTLYGSNLITVENGEVYVAEADCSSRDCVHMGRISRAGQMLVCLPHHLVVKITAKSETAPDAVVR